MQKIENTEKYQRCLVLPGGGFRFGYYLGVYAAAVDSGQLPDILLASCGGAIAAAVIAGLPNTQERLEWLTSRYMYSFLREIQPTDRATPVRVLGGVIVRWLDRAMASRVVDLFHDYFLVCQPSRPCQRRRRPAGPQLP
ncbi:patatin-like phospholipase family protein [Massilia sp. H6]|uniref:patatin-like phospholipase family protein n=1 Tax=Massilia sp. H6 TaxID=2970464 RepID=UPI00216929B7|nr:patatin-like phospholipase family protein [Massilia sp. H6]UVW27249.1 patatin-like phospholipase family protein [Massilia sp. H6]